MSALARFSAHIVHHAFEASVFLEMVMSRAALSVTPAPPQHLRAGLIARGDF